MNKFLLLVCLLCAFHIQAQSENPGYDEALAKSLGADEYGMKSYVLAILKTSSNNSATKDQIEAAFKGHMENMGKLVASGKLVVAGPFGKNDKNFRGIFILNVKTVAEAGQLLQTDPAIKDKLLDAELYPWYGSAALPEYLKSHAKIEYKKHN